jgi:hypothetical protein
MRKPMLCLVLILTAVAAGLAQDVTFGKTRYSSVKLPNEVDVNLTLTNSKILIKSKKVSKKVNGLDLEIPYSAVDSMSYESASRHRTGGVGLMAISPAAGAIVLATKTKSYWLDIEYHEVGAKQSTVLRLDKSEYRDVIAALESRTGKHVAMLDPSKDQLRFNPTAGSKNIDEVVPFKIDDVLAALKPAMEAEGCRVTHATGDRVHCKRKRGAYSERTGGGGEEVTATLKAQGEKTHVRIQTGKGFHGRIGKHNWSTPIYQGTLKNLQKLAHTQTATVPTSD